MRASMEQDEENIKSSINELLTKFEFFVRVFVENGLSHITNDIVKKHRRKKPVQHHY